MKAPFFSICIPVYNAELFIEETLKSIFSQAFTDWELIIRNDGSTDGSWEIVKRLTAGDPRVRLAENPRNLGQRATLNLLLPEAHGTWVGILPADDGYRAHTLQTIHTYVKDREDLVLWCHSRIGIGHATPDVLLIENHVTEWPSEVLADRLYLHSNIFGSLSNYLFRRSAANGLLFLGNDTIIDLYYWVRFLKSNSQGRAVYHPDVLSYVNLHANSLSVSCQESGEWLVMFFEFPCAVLYLGWTRQVRLLQIARLFKGWLRFFRQFAPGQRLLPLSSIAYLAGSLFRTPTRDRRIT
jgi:glycosyltransferase involved in cell wall biosynthesis